MQARQTESLPPIASASDYRPPLRLSVIVVVLAMALLVAGLGGQVSAAWGYALFVFAGASLSSCVAWVGVLVLTRLGDTAVLINRIRLFGRLGGAAYVAAVAALAGHYSYETLAGRMEWHWVVFGPVVLGALVAFEWGIYVKLVKANALTWRRYHRFIDRDLADPLAMKKTLRDDVVMHRTLWKISGLRWWRHTLIFWGFAGMFALELVAVFIREAVPAFGWPDVWRTPGHPIRATFDVLYDATGLMMLLGCVLALYWGWTVRHREERKFADRPMVLFLGFVVLSGFVVEGWRLALNPGSAGAAYSFVGLAFAWVMAPVAVAWESAYQPMWLIHVVASCALIAYIPFSRLVHTCATPLGRLMNSQKSLLAAKKMGVLAGLLRNPPHGAALGSGKDSSRS